MGFVILLVYQPSWTGFGVDSTKNIERDSTGKIVKTIEIEESSKTLWDWLGLLGVPIVLAILGYLLQQQEQRRVSEQAALEQRRASEQAALEKEIAEGDRREEALQIYFDRLSELLVDKNLIAIATGLEKIRAKPYFLAIEGERLQEYVDKHQQKLDAAVDVVRARTLSILRRLKDDRERKGSVVEFLIETEVVSKLDLDLSGADLSNTDLSGQTLSGVKLKGANLSGANLTFANLSNVILCFTNLNGAHLSGANLSGANLSGVKLKGANLSGADLGFTNLAFAQLIGANLSFAQLIGADLSGVNLSGVNLSSAKIKDANFSGANLSEADLSGALHWEESQISSAQLCHTELPKGTKLDPNRDCKMLEESEL